MSMGIGQLLVVLVIILLLFGAGKLPEVMSQLGKGMKSFKSAMNDGKEDKNEKE